jgi:hypothetical protein
MMRTMVQLNANLHIYVYNLICEMGATEKEGLTWLLQEEIPSLRRKTPRQMIE